MQLIFESVLIYVYENLNLKNELLFADIRHNRKYINSIDDRSNTP